MMWVTEIRTMFPSRFPELTRWSPYIQPDDTTMVSATLKLVPNPQAVDSP